MEQEYKYKHEEQATITTKNVARIGLVEYIYDRPCRFMVDTHALTSIHFIGKRREMVASVNVFHIILN